ncbi:hypothetical protein LIA77_11638 [Sarocladium implicatum]|nr:hypothetical protein LIA77_11638 [Sarocladium implicatum]
MASLAKWVCERVSSDQSLEFDENTRRHHRWATAAATATVIDTVLLVEFQGCLGEKRVRGYMRLLKLLILSAAAFGSTVEGGVPRTCRNRRSHPTLLQNSRDRRARESTMATFPDIIISSSSSSRGSPPRVETPHPQATHMGCTTD